MVQYSSRLLRHSLLGITLAILALGDRPRARVLSLAFSDALLLPLQKNTARYAKFCNALAALLYRFFSSSFQYNFNYNVL
jgi:hypothetical protein